MKRKLILVICAILSLLVLFCSCTVQKDSEESRVFCETMLDYVIQNDYEAAKKLFDPNSAEEFSQYWNLVRDALKDSKSFELQQKSWYKNRTDGVTTTRVIFEVITDNGKICQMVTYTEDGIVTRIGFIDSTEFIQKTEFVKIVNVFLVIFSLLCFVFSIWMLVDCLKRRLKGKILWALLTLCYCGISLTTDTAVFDFEFIILMFGRSSISANRITLTVAVTVFLPIGAIVYFFMRKRLTIPAESKAEEILAQGNGEMETEELFEKKKEETEA